jgi:drug/metabolite transporter (DMT)-like permease
MNVRAAAITLVALPFSLITFAEQSTDSTLAAILNASVPLFTILIAAAALADERITPPRVAGLAVGFVGVAILVGFDPGVVAGTNLVAALALVSLAGYGARQWVKRRKH